MMLYASSYLDWKVTFAFFLRNYFPPVSPGWGYLALRAALWAAKDKTEAGITHMDEMSLLYMWKSHGSGNG